MHKILIIINDAPYGTEKAYNALRLANQLGREHEQGRNQDFSYGRCCVLCCGKPNNPQWVLQH